MSMRRRIRILDELPLSPKPIGERNAATAGERRQHWQLGERYFDGTRAEGYGGYVNDGRWGAVADRLLNEYHLNESARILELGCAKGYLLAEIQKRLPQSECWGLDISRYALEEASTPDEVSLVEGNFHSLPFKSGYFDLVVSFNSLHNILTTNETMDALREVARVGGESLITVGAYQDLRAKAVLDQWAVVATTYLSTEAWLALFDMVGYAGDYDWFEPVGLRN